MSLRLVTPAASFPVTQAEAKLHCRVDGDDENDLIDAYIAAATAHVEAYTGRAIMEQTWELVLDDFTDSILLPKGPVQSVSSITYYDTDSVLQTLSTDDYAVDLDSDPQWVVRAEDATWPDVADGVNNVIIRFVAGYDTIPEPIKIAIFLLIAQWYDNRSATNVGNIVNEMPHAVDALLSNYRSFAF